jgi:3-phenylpropionate/cinnamic acid dioxygenase small subunit
VSEEQKQILTDRVLVFETEQAEYEKNNPRTYEPRKDREETAA